MRLVYNHATHQHDFFDDDGILLASGHVELGPAPAGFGQFGSPLPLVFVADSQPGGNDPKNS